MPEQTEEQIQDKPPLESPGKYRAELIEKGLKDLDRQFEENIKPIHCGLYYLIRNTAKYIVEQEDNNQQQINMLQQQLLVLERNCEGILPGKSGRAMSMQVKLDEEAIKRSHEDNRLIWVKCDKADFGIYRKDHGKLDDYLYIHYGIKEGFLIAKIPSLLRIMQWAEASGIPYEIRTSKED